MASACIVDGDEPCGILVETANGACGCPVGSIIEGGLCVACGEHETARGGECVCEEGHERRQGELDCQPIDATASFGDASPPVACTTDGGCASECRGSSECSAPQLCDVHASHTCIAPPDGLGRTCQSDADCAGSSATYCEIFRTLTCVVEACKEDGGRCPGDMTCCDYSVLGSSLCVPVDDLSAGACPAPGTLVPREE